MATKKKAAKKAAKKTTAKKAKHVYYFGAGKCDGDGSMKALLGGKGANLAEMSSIGVPVPAGFTITTEVCTHYYDNAKKYPKTLDAEIEANISKVEKALTPSSDPCCFTDITELKDGSGQCVQHHVKCYLPRALDGLVCGFSCKDFSKANVHRVVRRGHDISRADTYPGKSADTMHGFLDLLDSCNPDFPG